MMNYAPSQNRYDKMVYRRCGSSGLQLPVVSLGLWHNFGHVDDLKTGQQMLHTAFDNGITHFDLANNYGPPPGSAEENFGKILKQSLSSYRDELIPSITTSGSVPEKEVIPLIKTDGLPPGLGAEITFKPD